MPPSVRPRDQGSFPRQAGSWPKSPQAATDSELQRDSKVVKTVAIRDREKGVLNQICRYLDYKYPRPGKNMRLSRLQIATFPTQNVEIWVTETAFLIQNAEIWITGRGYFSPDVPICDRERDVWNQICRYLDHRKRIFFSRCRYLYHGKRIFFHFRAPQVLENGFLIPDVEICKRERDVLKKRGAICDRERGKTGIFGYLGTGKGRRESNKWFL